MKISISKGCLIAVINIDNINNYLSQVPEQYVLSLMIYMMLIRVFDTLICKNPYINKELVATINNISILQAIEREYNYKDDKLAILQLKHRLNEIDCQYLIK